MLLDLLNLFFPTYCLGCKTSLSKTEAWLCTGCFQDLPQTNYHQVVDNSMLQKFYGKVSICYAMAFFKYRKGSKLQNLIHELKYGNQPEIGVLLGKYYGKVLANITWLYPFQLIIPVPLHKAKLQQRGYNQSDYFAQGLSTSLGIPWQGKWLQRVRPTESQTRQNKLNRLGNLVDAFCVTDRHCISGKHVLLVDDIITTGATLEACAISLLESGAQQVSVATIGITE
jgi:ComF family protein